MKGSRLSLDQLRVFVDLARTRSFSRTAAGCGLTQSAVSQQLAALERLFGKRLVDRGKNRFALTAEGELARDGFARVLEVFAETQSRIRGGGGELSGTVRVETIYSIGLYDLAPYVRSFLKRYPGVSLHVEYSRANRILDNVLAGACDVGIVADPRPHSRLKMTPFRKQPMVLVCGRNDPLARRRRVGLKQLDGLDFIAFEEDVPTRGLVDRALARRGARVRVVSAFDNIDLIKRAVEIGVGVSILPEGTVLEEARTGTLARVPIADGPLTRATGIVVDKRRTLSLAARAFIDWLA